MELKLQLTTTNLNDVQTVAKLIACEAGANKLDELLVGAVLVNRWKDEQGRFGSTLIEVISQGNGKQYSTWASGAFQNATPTQRDYESAQQVLSGEFTIPKNVLFQSQKALGKLWLRNENVGPGNPHYYCWPKAEAISHYRLGRKSSEKTFRNCSLGTIIGWDWERRKPCYYAGD